MQATAAAAAPKKARKQQRFKVQDAAALKTGV